MKRLNTTTRVCISLLIASFSGFSQQMQGLLPYYRQSAVIFNSDYFEINAHVDAYNGWTHTTANDQQTFATALQIFSHIKFQTDLVFLNAYKYETYVEVSPIRMTPVALTVNYRFISPYQLQVAGTSQTTFGKIESYIYQRNKAFTGSFIDPIFDENVQVTDYVYDYEEPTYFSTKTNSNEQQKQIGLWNWDPLSSMAISKTFFNWDVLNMS
eukprot:403342094